MLERLSKHSDWAPLVLRVALGLVLAVHGYDKLFGSGIVGVSAFFASVSLPMPVVLAWLAMAIELLGGLLILVGALTRYAALAIALQFIVILLLKIFLWKAPLVDFKTGVGGYQLDVLIFAMAVVLVILGSGKLSLEKILLKKEF